MSSIVDLHRRRATTSTRLPPMNSRFLNDSSEDDLSEEDEETRLEREQAEEQERLLSELHGEAKEAADRKRKQQDENQDDIEAEYARKKPRQRRPTLTPAMVTGSRGLVRIRNEFPRNVTWGKAVSAANTRLLPKQNAAAATYSRTLVNAYKSFCHDLFPNSAFQDVLTRIESFGSKKDVRDYLQHLRHDVRNAHLEKLYGKDKAAVMIEELEHGLELQQQQAQMQGLVEEDEDLEGMHRGLPPSQQAPPQRGTFRGPDENRADNNNNAVPVNAVPLADEAGRTTTTAAAATVAVAVAAQRDDDDDGLHDTDDELEFDQAPPPAGKMTVTNKPVAILTNPFDENDDEEEFDNDKAKSSSSSAGSTDKETTVAETEGTQDKALEPIVDQLEEGDGTDATMDQSEERGAADVSGEEHVHSDTVIKETATKGQEEKLDDEPLSGSTNEEDPTAINDSLPTNETVTANPVVEKHLESSILEDEVATSMQKDEVFSCQDETANETVPTSSATHSDNVSTTQEPADSQDIAAGDFAQESLSVMSTQQEELGTSLSPDDTATIVPTMSTTAAQDGDMSQVDLSAQGAAKESAISQETATVVASMDTQTDITSDEGDAMDLNE